MTDIIGRAKVIVESALDKSGFDKDATGIGNAVRKGALVGVAALGGIAVESIRAGKAFEQSRIVGDKLNNVLDNMGKSSAHEGVAKLADEIMRTTGVDDELIKGGQTILATFSEVAASAGDAGGAFERASRAAVDLAAAGFGNIESASVMLGKALQDPVKGVSALGEAGVTFSEDQKKMIESLVKTGDVAAAQNIILKEVERQVKGTAEAGKSSSATIGTAFGELEESFGHVISKFTGKDGFESIADGLFTLSEKLDDFAESDGWGTTVDHLKEIGGAAREAYEWLDKVFATNDKADPTMSQSDARHQKPDRGGIKGLFDSFSKDFDPADNPLNGLYSIFDKFNLYLHDKWGADVKESFKNSWEDFKGEVEDNVETAKGDWHDSFGDAFGEIGKAFSEKWGTLKKDARKKFDDFKKDVRDVPKNIKSKANEWYDAAKQLMTEFGKGLGAGVKNLGTDLGKFLKDSLNDALGLPKQIKIPAVTVRGKEIFGGGSFGIDAFARGGRSGGGTALVGEEGAEFVDLPPGAHVTSAASTRARASEIGSSAQIVQYNTYIFQGPESFAGARRDSNWSAKHGTKFGNATRAVVPA